LSERVGLRRGLPALRAVRVAGAAVDTRRAHRHRLHGQGTRPRGMGGWCGCRPGVPRVGRGAAHGERRRGGGGVMATLGPYYLGPDTAHPAYGIYYGDCVRGMAKIPDGTVDIVLTSPPYNVGLNYTGFDDNASDGEFKAFNRRWLTEAYRVMRDTGRAYVVVGDKMLWWFKDLAEQIGWTYVQLLTWCKPNMAGGAAISGDWDHLTEQILLFRKGKRTPMLNGEGVNTHNWFVETAPQSNFNGHQRKRHPAQ